MYEVKQTLLAAPESNPSSDGAPPELYRQGYAGLMDCLLVSPGNVRDAPPTDVSHASEHSFCRASCTTCFSSALLSRGMLLGETVEMLRVGDLVRLKKALPSVSTRWSW